MLKQSFTTLTQTHSQNNVLPNELWNEIGKRYTEKGRYYHTLTHLENLFHQLVEVKKEIEDWETILFSLCYHDIVYNPTKNNNEEKSAELAKVRLQSIGYPQEKVQKCVLQILATKGHSKSMDHDTNLFTDADLSILGHPWDIYQNYIKQIRQEYSIYPDLLYNPGRKKVLNHFLHMESIFKTEYFIDKFEKEARQNLTMELKLL